MPITKIYGGQAVLDAVVVGSGICGLNVARTLKRLGAEPLTFRIVDKGTLAGGRMSSRSKWGETVQHGCCHFPAQPKISEEHRDFLSEIAGLGLTDRRGLVKTDELIRNLTARFPIQQNATVESVKKEKARGAWEVTFTVNAKKLKVYARCVVSTIPVPQVVSSLKLDNRARLSNALLAVRYHYCLVMLTKLGLPSERLPDELFRRQFGDITVVHTKRAFARRYSHSNRWDIYEALTGKPLKGPHVDFKTWRYGNVINPAPETYYEPLSGFLVGGDGCGAGGVEGALKSGHDMAQRVVEFLESQSSE